MQFLLLIILATASFAAQAQYKCVINGQTTYADQPCAANAQHVGKMQDYVPPEQRNQRLRQSIKERRQRNAIDARDNAEFATRKAQQAASAAAERNRAAQAARDKKYRCDGLRRRMTHNERGIARYRDFGWQGQLTQQEQELKQNREAYEAARCN